MRESDSNGNTLTLYAYAGDQLVAVEKNGAMDYVHTNTNNRGDILDPRDQQYIKIGISYYYNYWV